MAWTQTFQDTFARADGAVGNSWTDASSAWSIASNTLVSTSTTFASDLLSRPTGEALADQRAELVATTDSASFPSSCLLWIRGNAASRNGYVCWIGSNSGTPCLATGKMTGGSLSGLILTNGAFSASTQYLIRGEAVGDAITFQASLPGSPGSPIATYTFTDSSFTSGVAMLSPLVNPSTVASVTVYQQGVALSAGTASVTARGLTTATVATTEATAGTSPYAKQWQRSTTGGGAGFADVGGATSLTLDDTGLAQGTTYYYRCVFTDSAGTPATATSNEVSLATRSSQLVADGDSITEGAGLSAANSWPGQIAAILGDSWQIDNVGASGQTVAQMQSSRADADAFYDASNAANVVVCLGGTNDIYFDADSDDAGATTYARIVAYCNASRSTGFAVVVCTLLPRNDFPGTSTLPSDEKTHHEARRVAVNALIRANWGTFADALADVAADDRIGTDGAEMDAPPYQSDHVHPDATGQGYIAARVAGAIATAVNPGGAAGAGTVYFAS